MLPEAIMGRGCNSMMTGNDIVGDLQKVVYKTGD